MFPRRPTAKIIIHHQNSRALVLRLIKRMRTFESNPIVRKRLRPKPLKRNRL